MAQSGKVPSDASSPPFATSGGKPQGQGTTAGGGHDFLTDWKGSGPAAGGRDFNKEHRSQSEAKKEVEGNPQEIPSNLGGAHLKMDPTPVSRTVSGPAPGPKGVSQTPFKGLR